jgi:hypothetical protein
LVVVGLPVSKVMTNAPLAVLIVGGVSPTSAPVYGESTSEEPVSKLVIIAEAGATHGGSLIVILRPRRASRPQRIDGSRRR